MTQEKDDEVLKAFLHSLKTGEGGERMKQLKSALEAGERRRAVQPDSAEAREWLAANARKHPLALNHFQDRAEAEGFVEALYASGARRVSVENIGYDDVREWGGPSSDTLRVELPAERETRARVIALCNQHCMADTSTGAPFVDEGQPSVTLWWD